MNCQCIARHLARHCGTLTRACLSRWRILQKLRVPTAALCTSLWIVKLPRQLKNNCIGFWAGFIKTMKSTHSVTGTSLSTNGKSSIFWQHRSAAIPEFDQRVFDDDWLQSNNYVVNSPTAGRGASLFLEIDNTDLVLRHYRRGGMVRTLSEKHYVWHGLQRTRAWREFEVLEAMELKGLPSPRPYACQVQRHGLTYSASLITYFLSGVTLAERVCTAMLADEHWYNIGLCIRRFHSAGVDHADLNAHNILIHESTVSLIDFDRAVIQLTVNTNGLQKNLKRLKRSLNKIGSSGPAFYNDECWAALIAGYTMT